jgi:hypothetical protein
MTFTNNTPDPNLRVPFGWDVIEADDEPESNQYSLLEEEDTSFFAAEAVDDVHSGYEAFAPAQASSHPREAGQN